MLATTLGIIAFIVVVVVLSLAWIGRWDRRQRFDCPRRADPSLGFQYRVTGMNAAEYADYCEMCLDPNGKIPGQDRWLKHGDMLRRCSFCDSLHPDEFMDLVDSGQIITPTNHPEKIYVDGSVFYTDHFPRHQAGEFGEMLDQDEVNIAPPHRFYAGLYLHPARST